MVGGQEDMIVDVALDLAKQAVAAVTETSQKAHSAKP
jgi:hypothetical protein